MGNTMQTLLNPRHLRALKLALACLLLVLSTSVVGAIATHGTIDGKVPAAGDWDDEFCRVDSGGVDDASGARDLTRVCLASNYATVQPANTIYVRFDFDENSFTGASSGDGCVNFDTDGDGNVDRALCVTVENTPATITGATLYSCNDSKADRCAGSSALTFTGSCAIHTLASTNPFSAAANPDTDLECAIPVADIGMASVVRVNVCSYASQQPNSSPADCALGSSRVFHNVSTGTSGETTPTAILLLSFSGGAGASGLFWTALAGLLALVGALLLWRRQRMGRHALG